MMRSKRFLQLKKFIEKKKLYSYEEGIALLKQFGTTNFVESVEAHVALNLTKQNKDYRIKASLFFPYGTGRKKKIAVFEDFSNTDHIINLGATFVGINTILKQLENKKIDFDVLITPDSNKQKLLKFSKILGPKGLMPNENAKTLVKTVEELEESILLFNKGQIEYRSDKTGIVHVLFGNLRFTKEQLITNLHTFYLSLKDNKPIQCRGNYIKSFFICSTMSPSIPIDSKSFKLL